MILLLHEMEGLREFIIGSIRSTDALAAKIHGVSEELPPGAKKPFQKALSILVEKKIISEVEILDLQEINEIRNTIGHSLHSLVIDISNPDHVLSDTKSYDYKALERLERYKEKIEKGMGQSHVMLLSFRDPAFEQAALTYKEELSRLKIKIDRQYKVRFGKNA